MIYRSYCFIILALMVSACKKETTPDPAPPTPEVAIQPAIDPQPAGTIGFFMNDWQAKNFTVPAHKDTAIPATAASTVTEGDFSRKVLVNGRGPSGVVGG